MELPNRIRAFRAVNGGDQPERGVVEIEPSELGDDGVIVEVHYSSVNYKDGLASIPAGKVARIDPIIPGVDLAGVLLEDAAELSAGTEVIVHGQGLGEVRHGGFAEYARVPADWVLPLPDGLSLYESMALGTAGFTAALSVIALEAQGIGPDDGRILVTGATGGVGSTAVDMLSNLGYEVVASTGKPAAAQWLRDLGAAEIIDRAELGEESKRPLESMEYAGAVDLVGGVTLANVLKRIAYGGSVAASGLVGGPSLPTTVMPFILRGVNLLGIDSVMLPMPQRRAAWERLGDDLKPSGLDSIGTEIGLVELDAVLSGILNGEVTGRNIVALR